MVLIIITVHQDYMENKYTTDLLIWQLSQYYMNIVFFVLKKKKTKIIWR